MVWSEGGNRQYFSRKERRDSAAKLAGLEGDPFLGLGESLFTDLQQMNTVSGRRALDLLKQGKIKASVVTAKFMAGDYDDDDDDRFFSDAAEVDIGALVETNAFTAGSETKNAAAQEFAGSVATGNPSSPGPKWPRLDPETRKTWADPNKRAEAQRNQLRQDIPAPVDPETLKSWVMPGNAVPDQVVVQEKQEAGVPAAATPMPAGLPPALQAVIAGVMERVSKFAQLLDTQYLAVGGRGQHRAEHAAKVLIYDDFVRRAGGEAAKWVGAGAWSPLSEFTEMLKLQENGDPRIGIRTGEMANWLHPESGSYDASKQTSGALPPEVFVAATIDGGKNKVGGALMGGGYTAVTPRPWKPLNDEWSQAAMDKILECTFSQEEMQALMTQAYQM